ncbi:transposase, partial [Paraburkholderia steynii]
RVLERRVTDDQIKVLADLIAVQHFAHTQADAVLAVYFGERDRRFRERDRFGGVGRCAVLIVDFLVSSGRVRAPGRWVLGMPF